MAFRLPCLNLLMRPGILGSSQLGQTPGMGFALTRRGVRIGPRDSAKPELKRWFKMIKGKVVVSAFADAVEPEHSDRRILVDVTNPLDFNNGPRASFRTTRTSCPLDVIPGLYAASWQPNRRELVNTPWTPVSGSARTPTVLRGSEVAMGSHKHCRPQAVL